MLAVWLVTGGLVLTAAVVAVALLEWRRSR